jgi:signal transduction histidine kinase
MGSTPADGVRAMSSKELHARAASARDRARVLAEHNRNLMSHVQVSTERLSQLTSELNDARSRVSRSPTNKPDEDAALAFAARVSHELRAPLTAILGWLSILEQAPELAMRERAFKVIRYSAQRQERLIEDLLDVARLRSGMLSLSLTSFDPTQVLQATVDALQPALEDRAQQLQLTLEGGLLMVADASRLQQVISNLLRNAIKFTPRGGRIEASLRSVGEHVLLTVSDDGQGIDPPFLPHVFESYRQATHGDVRAGGGVGLGLAITQQIVQLHGGTIEARSEGLGRGSCFEVRLPRSGPSL